MSEKPTHPAEDDLVLHHYGEGEDGEALRAHLADCPECRAAFERVGRTLGAVEADEPPDPGPGYADRVWSRLQPRLAEPAARARPAGRVVLRRLAGTCVLAASLVGAFFLGRHAPRPDEAPAAGRERVLLVAVGTHLERSQVVLLELVNAEPGVSLDVSAERRSAEDLVAASRLYRQAATRTGEAGLARVLEELERLLVELANGPSELEPDDLQSLKRRIESQGVLFKVRVIGSQIREREKQAVTGPSGTDL